MNQVVQIPVTEWRRIERILTRIEAKERKEGRRADWIKAAQFAQRSGLTKEQIRTYREKHPDHVKPKEGNEKSARYLYNWTAYSEIYLTK